MSAAKHTPGPWEAIDTMVITNHVYQHVTRKGDVSHVKGRRVIDASSGHDAMEYPEAVANARLIAAAPDLLAVVQKLVYAGVASEDALDFGVMCDSFIADARAAIAKATGSAS